MVQYWNKSQDSARSSFGYADLPDIGSGFKDNIAQVGVYFRSLNTKLIKEEPKYGVINL